MRTTSLCHLLPLAINIVVLAGAFAIVGVFNLYNSHGMDPQSNRERKLVDEASSGDSDLTDQIEAELALTMRKVSEPDPKLYNEIYWKSLAMVVDEKLAANPDLTARLIESLLRRPDDGFANSLLCSLVSVLAKRNDAKSLTLLLSQRCPQRQFTSGIEDYLIIIARTPSAVDILCDSFDRSKSEATRQRLSEALERGFRFLALPASEKQSISHVVRSWYKTNGAEYEPNLAYLGHLSMSRFPYQSCGVLQKRGASKGEGSPVEVKPRF